MQRTMIYELLMKGKKCEIADLCSGLIDILNNRIESAETTPYKIGWNDSRSSILGLFGDQFEKFGIKL